MSGKDSLDGSDRLPTPRPKTALSRRKFLKGTVATAGAATALTAAGGSGIASAAGSAGVAGAAEACSVSESGVPLAVQQLHSDDPDAVYNGGMVSPGNFDTPGHPPRSAYRSLAETERRFRDGVQQQQAVPSMSDFDRVVHAVDDLGADPSGSQSAISAIESGVEDGTLIVLPKGATFLLDGKLSISGNKVGMVGEGIENASGPPGDDGPRFVSAPDTQARVICSAEQGFYGYFLMDQSANRSGISMLAESDNGFCYVRDVRVIGAQDDTTATGAGNHESDNHPVCAPIAHGSNSAVRVQRMVMVGTGYPGDKNSGGVPGFWVGKETSGLVELVQCVASGGSDNGIYGSRTKGDLHVIDGAYINNTVSQIRFAGKGSWAKGCTLAVDKEQYTGPEPSKLFNEYATNGVKTEMPDFIHKQGGGSLENCEIIARNVENIGSLIFVRGFSGALTVNNCRVVNGVQGMTSLRASAPGTGYGVKTKPPYAVSVSNSTFTGIQNSNPAVEIQGRPSSVIANTCFKMEGASESVIQGTVSTKNVTYGPNCKNTGTTGPVGSAASAAQGAYSAAAGFVQQQVQRFFYGAAAIASVPFVVIIAVGLLGLLLASSLIVALALAAGTIKIFSKQN